MRLRNNLCLAAQQNIHESTVHSFITSEKNYFFPMQFSLGPKTTSRILFWTGGLSLAAGTILVIFVLQKPVDLLLSALNFASLLLLFSAIMAGFFTSRIMAAALFITGFFFSFIFLWLLMEHPGLVAGTLIMAFSAVLMLRAVLSADGPKRAS